MAPRIGMTRVGALELGAHGITANAIGPSPIRTKLFDRANPSDSPRTKAIIEGVPVKQVAAQRTRLNQTNWRPFSCRK